MLNASISSYKKNLQHISNSVHSRWNNNSHSVYWNGSNIEVVEVQENSNSITENPVYTISGADPGVGFTVIDLTISPNSKWVALNYFTNASPATCFCDIYEQTTPNVWTFHSSQSYTVILASDYPREVPVGIYSSIEKSINFSSDENVLVISSVLDSQVVDRSGAIFIFKYESSVWSFIQKVVNTGDPGTTVDDPTNQPPYVLGSYFGFHVKLSNDGTKIIVSAPARKKTYDLQGEVKVYVKTTTWALSQTIDAPTPSLGSYFGSILKSSSDNSRLVISQTIPGTGDRAYEYLFSGGSYSTSRWIVTGENLTCDLTQDGLTLYYRFDELGLPNGFIKKAFWNGIGYVHSLVYSSSEWSFDLLWVSLSEDFLETSSDQIYRF